MELAHQPYAIAGVALAAASLIAVTPVAPPALDLQQRAVQLTAVDPGTVLGEIPGVLQTVINGGLSDISTGVAALGTGEVPLGLYDFANAGASIFLAAPEDLFLGVVDALVGQQYEALAPFSAVPPATDLAVLISDLQSHISFGVTEFTTGLEQLLQGSVDQGLLDSLFGLDDIFYFAPTNLFADSLGVLAATLDPGAVAAAVDPAALSGLAADLPTMLLSLIP